MSQTTGWKEWAKVTIAIRVGCERNCYCCWARILGMQRGYVKSLLDWCYPRPKASKITIPKNTTVGFPATHDITEENYQDCVKVIDKILENNNRLLIVSKPDYDIIQKLIVYLNHYSEEIRERIEFRFSISTYDEKLLKIFEPHASSFDERLDSLKEAFYNGFKTSVSIEPYITRDLIGLINRIYPFVTSDIWIGKMNYFSSACKQYPIIEELEHLYTKETIQEIYEELMNYEFPSLVSLKFKDTFLKIAGVDDS